MKSTIIAIHRSRQAIILSGRRIAGAVGNALPATTTDDALARDADAKKMVATCIKVGSDGAKNAIEQVRAFYQD